MKRVLTIVSVVTVLSFSLFACSKSDKAGGNFGNNPSSPIPDDLVGYWIAGSTSISNFWGYDGAYQGAAFELATGYMLYKDGKAKQYIYYTNTSYNCRSQVLGYKEGTVVMDVNNKTFTFYPASGNYRGYTCGGTNNGQTKKYGANELHPAVTNEYEEVDFKKENGKIKSWHIYFEDGSSLDFTKSQEPQK